MGNINPLLSLGAHVIAPRLGYTHHGLYLGDGNVLEYLLQDGVGIVSLEDFAQGNEIYIREHPNAPYRGFQAVSRGMMRLGEKHYNLLTRNCEHFVNWCIEGVETSRQVDNLILTIIPFYSIFQKSDFIKGCLKVVFDDPSALDQAISRINTNHKRARDPLLRAQELSEDIFGSQKAGIVNLANLFTTAAQCSSEYEKWTGQKPSAGLKQCLSRSLEHSAEAIEQLSAKLGMTFYTQEDHTPNKSQGERAVHKSLKVIGLISDLLHNSTPQSPRHQSASEYFAHQAQEHHNAPSRAHKISIPPSWQEHLPKIHISLDPDTFAHAHTKLDSAILESALARHAHSAQQSDASSSLSDIAVALIDEVKQELTQRYKRS